MILVDRKVRIKLNRTEDIAFYSVMTYNQTSPFSFTYREKMDQKIKFVSLITDFGNRDGFVGIMKGVMLKINPDLHFIDISHELESFDLFNGAFVVERSLGYFPDDTIHLVVVDPGVGTLRRPLILSTKKGFFVGPDNGVLTPVLESQELFIEAREINNKKYFLENVSSNFHGRDIFAPVVAHLSLGEEFERFGSIVKNPFKLHLTKPKIKKSEILGEIIYVDNFGNLITNIPNNHLTSEVQDVFCGKNVCMRVGSYGGGFFRKLSILEGSHGYLEIFLKEFSASEEFGIKKGQEVRIKLK
jgi:S-adenosylmethionine hydrolase